MTTQPALVSLAQALALMTDREVEVITRGILASYALSAPATYLSRWRKRCRAVGLGDYSLGALRDAVRTVGSLDALRTAYLPVQRNCSDEEVRALERATGIPTPGGSSRAGTGPIGDKGSTALPGRNDSPGETTLPGRNSYPGRKDSPVGNSAPEGEVKRKRRRRRR